MSREDPFFSAWHKLRLRFEDVMADAKAARRSINFRLSVAEAGTEQPPTQAEILACADLERLALSLAIDLDVLSRKENS